MKGAEHPYQGRGLIADPIHQYILYTRPRGIAGEATEQDLIDTAWVQRLRRVPQLQSARWVYPAAEHSRFQHSLGAMHLASRAATHLYPSLVQACEPETAPSQAYVESLVRVAALLHDVGHGPFGHFGGFGPFAGHHALRQLDLTDEQKTQIKGILKSHREEFHASLDKLRTLHETVGKISHQQGIDEAAIPI